MKKQLVLLSLLVSSFGFAEVEVIPQKNQEFYKLKISGQEAKALSEVLDGKQITSELFVRSLKCESSNSCAMDIEAYKSQYTERTCQNKSCEPSHDKNVYGIRGIESRIDRTPLLEKFGSMNGQALIAPISGWYFRQENKFVKSYAKIFKLLEKSKSPFVEIKETDEGTQAVLKTSDLNINCLKLKGLNIDEQEVLSIPHGPTLLWKYFKNNYFCSVIAFPKN